MTTPTILAAKASGPLAAPNPSPPITTPFCNSNLRSIAKDIDDEARQNRHEDDADTPSNEMGKLHMLLSQSVFRVCEQNPDTNANLDTPSGRLESHE